MTMPSGQVLNVTDLRTHFPVRSRGIIPRTIGAVTSATCAAMPACVSQSPALVIVRSPVMKVSFSLGTGVGPQRNWPIGKSLSRCGAVRARPPLMRSNRPV